MSAWAWILAAAAVAYLTKLAGYLLPDAWLDRPWVQPVTGGVTVGLLASLVVVNGFVSGTTLVLDARAAAAAAAGIALWLRAPFLLVVVLGAVVAALARLAGL